MPAPISDTVENDVAAHYDQSVEAPFATAMREGSLYFNYGYWHEGAVSMFEASERLMAELVARAGVPKDGAVLDVACGMGATTSYIAKNTEAGRVVGINISDKQLETCRESAPDLEFLNMSAVDMSFEDGTFDTIFCVEAAFHFDTRRSFLIEARRVLKPGGRIVMTDIPNPAVGGDSIEENRIGSMSEYDALLTNTGFKRVSLIDRTEECLGGFRPFLLFFRDAMMQRGQMTWRQYGYFTRRAAGLADVNYVEVVAEAV